MCFYGKFILLDFEFKVGEEVIKIIKCFFFLLLVLLFLNGCNPSNVNEDIFQFKDSYVGDNGAVGNITMRLPSPNGEHLNGLELKTTKEPYGIILNYKKADTPEEIEKNYKETAIYNATFIFALVKNADWVTFNFVDQEYRITREKLQKWYGKNLREFTNEEDLAKLTQEFLADEGKVSQFFRE